jgi:hypothetical protein
MIASAIHSGDVDSTERPFQELTVYVDTPTVIDALGRAGPIPQAAARESLRLLNRAGARIACFPHTVTEVGNVFYGVAEALSSGFRKGRPPAFGSIEQYVISEGLGSSDLLQWAQSIEDNIAQMPSVPQSLTSTLSLR